MNVGSFPTGFDGLLVFLAGFPDRFPEVSAGDGGCGE